MMLDKLALFEDKLALSTLAVATTVSTSSYDTGAAGAPNAVGPGGAIGGTLLHDVGRGRAILLLIQIGTAAASATGTLEEDFITADNGPLTTNKTVILPGVAANPAATLVAGYRFPPRTLPNKVIRQFMGIQHIVATAVFTAGTLSAGLALGTDDHADILGGSP